MTGPEPGRLRVEADLAIEVDGTSARLTGSGDRLVLSSSNPERLWLAAIGSALPAGIGDLTGPGAVARLADGLADAGLHLEVTGPRGSVLQLGDGVRSGLGRTLIGSSRVCPGAPTAVAGLVRQQFPRLAAGAATAAVGAVFAVLVLTRRWARRRWARRPS